MYAKILKLAKAYEHHIKIAKGLTKKASITSDLAVRIMHSLVPKATEHPMEAQFAQTHLAQKHLLGVAERYMERAAKIIQEELVHCQNPAAYKRATVALKAKNYLSVARIGAQEFAHDNWEEGFGGKRWRQFSEQLANLGYAIKSFKDTIKGGGDEKSKREAAGMITVYMNVLDGLTHNTGSFLDKMIRNESQEAAEATGKSSEDIYMNKKQEAFEMMDVKQLNNSDNVLPFIKKYMYGNPDGYLYREYYSKLLRDAKPNMENARQQLAEIRKKKGLINGLDRSLDNIINKMERDARTGDFSNIKSYYDYITGITRSSRWKEAASVTGPILQKYNLEQQFRQLSSQNNNFDRMLNSPRVITRLLSHYMRQQGGQGEYVIQYEGSYFTAKCEGQNCVVEPTDPVTASQPGVNVVYVTKDNLAYMLGGGTENGPEQAEKFLIDLIKCGRELRQAIVSFFELGLSDLGE